MAQVKVFSLGGLGGPCCCDTIHQCPGCVCPQLICLFHCGGTGYPYTCGATVTTSRGGHTISSGTISSGKNCIILETSGFGGGPVTITVVPSTPNYATTTVSPTVSCSRTIPTNVILSPASGYQCCAPEAFPVYTTLTDGNGSHPIVSGLVCYTTSKGGTYGNATPFCGCHAPGTNPIFIGYSVNCISGVVSVTRYWGECNNYEGACANGWAYYPALAADGSTLPCTSVNPFIGGTFDPSSCLGSCTNECNPCNIGTSSGTYTYPAPSCSYTPTISVGLTASGGNQLGDPVGGSVTIS